MSVARGMPPVFSISDSMGEGKGSFCCGTSRACNSRQLAARAPANHAGLRHTIAADLALFLSV